MDILHSIAHEFAFEGQITDITPLGEGFINDTYIVTTEHRRYILQRKNHHIFPDVAAMMDNIARITTHLKAKVSEAGGDPMREVLTIVPTNDGKLYHTNREEFWAACL